MRPVLDMSETIKTDAYDIAENKYTYLDMVARKMKERAK